MDIKKLPELLSPCGSPDTLGAAIYAGADAVYFGGKCFNARMNAKNFDDEALLKAIDTCHKNGVKAYITLNTQIYDRELEDAVKYTDYLYRIGADALICADLGLAALIRKYIPDLELHASTQCSGHSVECAKALQKAGFSRMVCAREATYENLCTLTENSPIETEFFIHGAMCVCHSGQCLMSSVIGGRSGNRGECAQPCRMKYNGTYPLSLKDMCLGSHITELIESGVASLKIEGRMKSPEYVYEVTSLYRKLLDENRNATVSEIRHLADIFSRGGFSDGYFTGKINSSMLGIRSEKDKEASKAEKTVFKKCVRNLPEIKREIHPAKLPPHSEFATKQTKSQTETVYRFMNINQIPQNAKADIIYLPLDKFVKNDIGVNGVIMPAVIFDNEWNDIYKKLDFAVKNGAKHVLITNIGQIDVVNKTGLTMHGDYRLNCCNSHDFYSLCSDLFGLFDITASPELTLPQLRDLPKKKSVIVYGHLPLMLLEKSCECSSLTDRTGAVFNVINEGKRELVLNSVPIYMADKLALLEKNGLYSRQFIFTVETKSECAQIIEAYKKGTPPRTQNVKRIKT